MLSEIFTGTHSSSESALSVVALCVQATRLYERANKVFSRRITSDLPQPRHPENETSIEEEDHPPIGGTRTPYAPLGYPSFTKAISAIE